MRLQAFLIHEGRTVPIEPEAAIPVIKKKCMIHIRKLRAMSRPHLYRGIMNFQGSWGVVDPKSSSERKSAHTSNHTTLLMDNLPSWKAYPKRSQSIVCSTYQENAGSYGKLYHVYPSDQCKFGVVPDVDVWQGFDISLNQSVSVFNRLLQSRDISDTSWSKMKGGLIRVYETDLLKYFKEQKGKYMTHGNWENEKGGFIRSIANAFSGAGAGRENKMLWDFVNEYLTGYDKSGKGLDIIKWMDRYMSPEYNKFTQNLTMAADNNEVWIGNAPIFIVSVNEEKTLGREDML
jgi:hypothetical protein